MVASTIPLKPEQFKNRLIKDGLKSIEIDPRMIRSPHKLEGSREGFELCRNLNTPGDFQQIIAKRYQEHRELIGKRQRGEVTLEDCWKHRFATVQIELVWECMKIAWDVPGTRSARAVCHIAELLGYSMNKTHPPEAGGFY